MHCHYRTTDRILITLNNYRLLLDKPWTCGQRYASNLVVIKLKQYQHWYRWILSKSRFKWSFADRENQYVAQRSSGNSSSNTYSNFWGYQCTYKLMWPPHTSVERSCFSNDRFGKMCLLNYRFKCDLSIRIIKTLNLEESM